MAILVELTEFCRPGRITEVITRQCRRGRPLRPCGSSICISPTTKDTSEPCP